VTRCAGLDVHRDTVVATGLARVRSAPVAWVRGTGDFAHPNGKRERPARSQPLDKPL